MYEKDYSYNCCTSGSWKSESAGHSFSGINVDFYKTIDNVYKYINIKQCFW